MSKVLAVVPEEREIWKEIPGTEGIYYVSSFGRIKRVLTQSGKVIEKFPKCNKNVSDDYTDIWLHINGKLQYKKVHQLVMLAFVGPPPEGHIINHKDCVKSNNCLYNLEYVTPKDNIRHAVLNGRYPSKKGSKNPNAKLSEKQLKVIKRVYSSKDVSKLELSILTGISRTQLSRILSNESRGY